MKCPFLWLIFFLQKCPNPNYPITNLVTAEHRNSVKWDSVCPKGLRRRYTNICCLYLISNIANCSLNKTLFALLV